MTKDIAARRAEAWQKIDSSPAGARELALELCRAMPGEAQDRVLLAGALRRMGQIEAARDVLGPLMGSLSKTPIACFEWAMILAAGGDDEAAVVALRRVVGLEAGFTAAWRALADVLITLGRAEEAGAAYAGALVAAASDAGLRAAAVAIAEGATARAESLLRVRLQGEPGDVRAQHLLAEAFIRLGRAREAELLLQHCLAQAEGFAAARHMLAILFYLQRRFAEAAAQIGVLLEMLPHQPGLRTLLAACRRETGDYAGAVEIYEQILAAAPRHHSAWLVYGHALKALGREAEAARAYRTCLTLAPGWAPSLYLSLADLKTTKLSDADLGGMRGAFGGKTSFGRAQLHYAIGHVLDQRGDYAGAFASFAQGAALRREAVGYEADEVRDFVAESRRIFDAGFFAARAGMGVASDAPIFVVGLPRSGSTLVEQILASHPAVEATFELTQIGAICAALRGEGAFATLPSRIAALDAEALGGLGQGYLAATRQFRRLGRAHFIDKMPGNALQVGLIHAILPQARIIDVRRAPMAAGFAAFRQFFQAGQGFADFTYDLRDIGRYYRDYEKLMAHMDSVLPGRVFHLQYEELVTDTEGSVRAMLDYCGLAFEPACLRFWETERAVQSPSALQVRRPVSREGLDYWRHYEAWLGPLKEGLKEGLLF